MKDKYKDLFEYYDGLDKLPEGAFKISPSGVEKFFSDKVTWYRENLLGEAKKFTGSTSTTLGTVCHAAAEVVANSIINGEPYDSEELKEAIEDFISTFDDNEDYDTQKIRDLWYNMSSELIKEYVVQANTVATEEFILHDLGNNVFVGGTYDAITSSAPTDTWEDIKNGTNVGSLTVRDYKTASSKPSTFNWGYTLQAYTYAYILHQQGIKVNEVELCFAVQPTKTLPVRTFNFKKPFDDHAYNMIEGILKLIAESVQCWNEYPDCRYLLAGDYRLRSND